MPEELPASAQEVTGGYLPELWDAYLAEIEKANGLPAGTLRTLARQKDVPVQALNPLGVMSKEGPMSRFDSFKEAQSAIAQHAKSLSQTPVQAQVGGPPETAARAASPPPGAALLDPITREEMQDAHSKAQIAHADPEEAYHTAINDILTTHSQRLEPNDFRVARRINPDTGSDRLVGAYMVPGDPINEGMTRGLSPEDKAKLPWISQAILAGRALNFLYGSAEQEDPTKRATAEARRAEYSVSSAAQRIAGETEQQKSLITMIPEQLVATQPKWDKKEGRPIPSNTLMEGFGSDKALNNSEHIFNAAKQTGTKIAYQGRNDPNYLPAFVHYIQNQAHGYRGDGSGPDVDESGQPNQIWLKDQQRPGPQYVPHLLSRPQAEFIHASLNIVPGKKVGSESGAPSFAEHAKWLQRINRAYAGHDPGMNALLDELDRKMPQVPQRRKNRKTGEIEPTGKMLSWRKGVLEPTWRAHRVELMEHPEAGAQAMRETAAPEAAFQQAPHYRRTTAEFENPPSEGEVGSYARSPDPEIHHARHHDEWGWKHQSTPIEQDPLIGAPIGAGDEKITHAALQYPSGKRYLGINHAEAYWRADQAGEPGGDVAEQGFHTNHGRFISRVEAWKVAKKAGQVSKPTIKTVESVPIGSPWLDAEHFDPERFTKPSEGEVGSYETAEQPTAAAKPIYAFRGGGFNAEKMGSTPQFRGNGVAWFTPQHEPAQIYANRAADTAKELADEGVWERDPEAETPYVGHYQLDIKNPFDMSQPLTKEFLTKFNKEWDRDRKEKGFELLPKDRTKFILGQYKAGLPRLRERGLDDSIFNSRGVVTSGTDAIWRRILKRMGYDGIYFHGPDPIRHKEHSYEKHYAQYAAFDPEQVKDLPQNAEVGSPETRFTPGPAQPGLIGAEAAQQGASAPMPQPAEPQGGQMLSDFEPGEEGGGAGMEFASPSIREGMKLAGAKKALGSDVHASYKDYVTRLERDAAAQSQTRPAEVRDALGSWTDGAENSLRSVYDDQDAETRRIVSSLKGLHSAQKNVLNFRYDPEGPHFMYHLGFKYDSPDKVAKLLEEHGLSFRTLEGGKGQPVWAHIVDKDKSAVNGIDKLFEGGHINQAYRRLGHAEMLGDPNETSREDAATAFRRTLQEARDKDAQRQGRGGSPSVPWWEPYWREAEENFQKLRASDEYENQQVAQDYKQSAADLNDIPPEQKAKLAEYQHRAKDWIANEGKKWEEENPQWHRQTMYAYLLGKNNFPIDPETGQPRINMTKADIAAHVERMHKKLDFSKPSHREKAAEMMLYDMMHSLAGSFRGDPSAAYGWYDRAVSKTFDKMEEVAPKIKTDPLHNLAFRLGLAITSQGQKVPENAESSWHTYNYWQQHQNDARPFPESNEHIGAGGKEITQIENNFRKVNDLWEKYGPEAVNDILTSKMSVKKLKEKYGLDVSGEAKAYEVRGAMGLGPKIGAFFSNLSGIFDPVTMDRWFARQMNFYGGDMFGFSETPMKKGTKDYAPHLDDLEKLLESPEAMKSAGPEEIKKMRAEIAKLRAVPEGKMTRNKAKKLAPEIHAWAKRATGVYGRSYAGQEDKPQRSFHPDFDTPENGLAKRMHENVTDLADAPRNSGERDAFRNIVGERVEAMLKAHGIHLTNADKQAVPWFDIKDVFRLAGSNALTNVNYLDAAYTLVRRIKQGLIPNLLEPEAKAA